MKTLRSRLLRSLPMRQAALTMRLWKRADVDCLAEWPPYGFPYEGFNLSVLGKDSRGERDAYFGERNSDRNRVYLVIDHTDCEVIGLFILVDIDWDGGNVGNMGIRIRPDWCGKGIGTTALSMLCDWAFQCGVNTIRLDVAAPNGRAIRCYEKAGFRRVGEFWRDDRDLSGERMAELERASVPIRPHVRFEEGVAQVRFFWMEATRK